MSLNELIDRSAPPVWTEEEIKRWIEGLPPAYRATILDSLREMRDTGGDVLHLARRLRFQYETNHKYIIPSPLQKAVVYANAIYIGWNFHKLFDRK